MDYAFVSLGPALSALALAFIFLFLAAAVFVVFRLAGLPGRIALARRHPQADAINICGWLGILTGVCWIVALVWAYWRPGDAAAATRAGDASSLVRMLADRVARVEEAVAWLERHAERETGT
jgi:hypothetical protein